MKTVSYSKHNSKWIKDLCKYESKTLYVGILNSYVLSDLGACTRIIHDIKTHATEDNFLGIITLKCKIFVDQREDIKKAETQSSDTRIYFLII